MKFKIEFEGDTYEDRLDLQQVVHASDAFLALYHAREVLRSHRNCINDCVSMGKEVPSDIMESYFEDMEEALNEVQDLVE